MNLNEIDDLDDDLMQEEPSQQTDDNPSYEEHPYDDDYPEDNTVEEEPQEEEDVISAFLRSKGINPNSIKFTGEDGQQEEHKFEDLSAEEQLQILLYLKERVVLILFCFQLPKILIWIISKVRSGSCVLSGLSMTKQSKSGR